MKTISISGQRRENTGKSATRQLRSEGYVPCELYGKNGNVHFSVFSTDFKPLVYSPDKFKIELTIDGENYIAIMREVQFHPLNDQITHVDFHEVHGEKPIKVELPVTFKGVAPGVREGGKFIKKLRTIKVKGLPSEMPDSIEVDISNLGMGRSIRVKDVIATAGLEFHTNLNLPLATVEVPRGMKGKEEEGATATASK